MLQQLLKGIQMYLPQTEDSTFHIANTAAPSKTVTGLFPVDSQLATECSYLDMGHHLCVACKMWTAANLDSIFIVSILFCHGLTMYIVFNVS